jgi:hypothetical protein
MVAVVVVAVIAVVVVVGGPWAPLDHSCPHQTG